MDTKMNMYSNILEHYTVAVVIPRRYTIHNISMHCYSVRRSEGSSFRFLNSTVIRYASMVTYLL